MSITPAYKDFVSFMESYTEFLGRMRADEKEKLASLSTRELPRIEHSIAVSQANAKQLENYEKKRVALQGSAGYEGMTFRQLIAAAPEDDQDALWQLFTRFEGTVAEIRFLNDKSMAVARDNMMEIDPSAVLSGQQSQRADNPYEKIREEQNAQNNILETKV